MNRMKRKVKKLGDKRTNSAGSGRHESSDDMNSNNDSNVAS